MKIFFWLGLLLVLVGFQSFSASSSRSNNPYTASINCDSIPKLNRDIVTFVTSNLKKKVGRGECWDLAAEALNSANASWDGEYKYGKEVDPKTDCIYPGDIIQFEDVQIEYNKNGGRYMEFMPHHTAVVYKVNAKGNYEIAHQNFQAWGRKVGVSNLELKNVTKGKLMFYRPVR